MTEQQPLAAPEQDAERYRALVKSIDAGFCIVRLVFDDTGAAQDYIFEKVNPAFEAQTGLVDAEGKSMRALRPTHEQHWFETYGRVAQSGQPEHFEHEAAALGRWYDVHAFRVGEPAAHEVAILFEDITERHQGRARQDMLLAELQHRVRNTLGVVRSIARRTALNSNSVEDFAAHLDGRLEAFARVQAVVTRELSGGVDLMALIEDELLAHATHEGEGLALDGPAISLAARPAETLSLAIHELVTNAVKYGALSVESGRITIMWRLAAGQLELVWRESGVPGPLAEPSYEGFGFEMLRRVVPYELGAETALAFAEDGLAFTLSMPVEGNLRTP